MLKEDIQKEFLEKKARIEEERTKAMKDSALVAKEKTSIQNLKMELEVCVLIIVNNNNTLLYIKIKYTNYKNNR